MSKIILSEQAGAPTTPAAGKAVLYVGSDGQTRLLDDTGSVHILAVSGNPIPIGTLIDVSVATAVSGETLTFDGTVWVPTLVSGASSDLNALTDVAITTPTSGQTLNYNGTTWLNEEQQSSAVSYSGLTDVNTGPWTSGQMGRYDGTNWQPFNLVTIYNNVMPAASEAFSLLPPQILASGAMQFSQVCVSGTTGYSWQTIAMGEQ